MQKEIAVLIGGPGTGKSTLLKNLEEKGYGCFPEISREITLAAKQDGIDQLFLKDPLFFSELLLEGRKGQFKAAVKELSKIVFIDRGIPDIIAYLNYLGLPYPQHFNEACREFKYSKVFVFPPWETIFESDNERYENYGQAKAIHESLVQTYSSLGYGLIDIPKDSVENRVAFILAHFK